MDGMKPKEEDAVGCDQPETAVWRNQPARVMIAIPTRGDIRPETALWLVHAVRQETECNYRATVEVYVGPFPIDHMRNLLVRRFLETDNDYLFFLDSDCEPDPDTLRRLLAHDKDIVGSVCPAFMYPDDKSEPIVAYAAYVMDASKWPPRRLVVPLGAERTPDGLMEVDALGGSGVLIKRHVLETMSYPWFLVCVDPDNGDIVYGEDSFFCLKAREEGFRVWADYGCVQKHYKTVPLAPGMSTRGRLVGRRSLARQG